MSVKNYIGHKNKQYIVSSANKQKTTDVVVIAAVTALSTIASGYYKNGGYYEYT